MIAVFLLIVVIVDTCITSFLLARVKQLNEIVVSQARVLKDLSASLSDVEGEDGE